MCKGGEGYQGQTAHNTFLLRDGPDSYEMPHGSSTPCLERKKYT